MIASPAEAPPGRHLAELAYRQLTRREADDLTVSPIYLTPEGGVSA